MASFNNLWRNYPETATIKQLCTNKQSGSNNPFGNYCAISLSECFNRSAVDLSLFPGNRCWSHSGKKHVLLAEDLAAGLRNHLPLGFSLAEKVVPGSFQSTLSGKTGVIFFKDYWQRGSETFANRSGDHIDLWNESRITNHSMFYRSIIELFGLVSDLNKSKEVWFWEVK